MQLNPTIVSGPLHPQPVRFGTRRLLRALSGVALAGGCVAFAGLCDAAVVNPTPPNGGTTTVNTDPPNPSTGTINTLFGDATVNVLEGAIFQGSIDLLQGSVLNNDGTITEASANAESIDTTGAGGPMTLTNRGLIDVRFLATALNTDFTFVNEAGANYNDLISFSLSQSGTTTITNRGGMDFGTNELDIANPANGTVFNITNEGTMQGTGTTGVVYISDIDAGASVTLTNTATGTITNTAGSGYGVFLLANEDTVVIENAGTVSGGAGAVFVSTPASSTGGVELTNSGTLTSLNNTIAVQLTDADDLLEITPTSVINGAVQAGGNTGTGDTLRFGGTTGTGTFNLDNIGAAGPTGYREFENFEITGATWTLSGTTTEDIDVQGGSVVLDAASTGGLILANGVNLSGSTGAGGINGLTANTGSTVSPGTGVGSIATLDLVDNFVLQNGATLQLDIASLTSRDQLALSGGATATLDAGSAVELSSAFTGSGSLDDADTIVVIGGAAAFTDNGVNVTDDFVGFTFAPSVVANELVVTATEEAIAPNLTDPTAAALAGVIDTDAGAPGASPEIEALRDQIGSLNAARATTALSSTTPRAAASGFYIQNRIVQRYHTALSQHILARNDAATTAQIGADAGQPAPGEALALVLATDGEAAMAEETKENGWGGYASAYAIGYELDAASDLNGIDADIYVGQIGIDHGIGDNGVIGLGFSFANSQADLNDTAGGDLGELESNTFRVGPYAGWTTSRFTFDASVTFGYHDNESTRRNPGTGGEFEGDYDSYDLAAYLGASYDVNVEGWRLTPRAGLEYVYTEVDGYTETGGGGALAIGDADFNTLRGNLGLTVSKLFESGDLDVRPRAQVGYAYDFLDNDDALNATFAGGTTSFATASGTPEQGGIYYGLGVAATLDQNLTLDLSYFGEINDDEQTDMFRVAVRLDF